MTTPAIRQVLNFAQSFYVDPETVAGAREVGISSIELFFKQKPNPTGNKSGISNPGVDIFIVETTPDKRPVIEPIILGSYQQSIARVEYVNITVSANASRATKFKFSSPVKIQTGKEYAIVGKYDGNEDFVLWTSKQGDLLVGTNKVSPGPSGKYIGNYYTTLYVTPQPGVVVPAVEPAWVPISDTDLKFKVNVARYAINGALVGNTTVAANLSPNTVVYNGQPPSQGPGGTSNVVYGANSVQFNVATGYYEYVVFDRKSSKPQVRGGELVYQNTVFWPGGAANPVTVSVTNGSTLIVANTLLPNGSAFNWNSIYSAGTENEYVVVISLNDDNPDKRRTNILEVVEISSNTVLKVASPADFTNSAAYFIKSPVGQVSHLNKTLWYDRRYLFNRKQRFCKKTKQDLLTLKFSNANAVNRFVNDTINSVSISTGGTSYTNSDFIYIFGYEDNAEVKTGYPGRANLVTNSTGGITAVYLTNVGCGFIERSNVKFVVCNTTTNTTTLTSSSANTTLGSGANLSITIGTVLRAEFDGDERKGGFFSNCEIVNLEVYDVIPSANINNPTGVKWDFIHTLPYYVLNSSTTWLGLRYCIDNVSRNFNRTCQLFKKNHLLTRNKAVLVSRSNEFTIIDANTGNVHNPGANNTGGGGGIPPGGPGGSGNVTINAVSNNDFVCVQPEDIQLTFSRFNINNDYTFENTNYGNALSKHITTKVTFAQERFAEDLIVYLTAYRPENTDIKVFARIHNSKDPEAFDDKDWTMLELRSGDIYSSSADSEDFIEMGFGFQQHPNTQLEFSGLVSIANQTTSNIEGSSTTFQSNAIANVQPKDVVKIYSVLFPNTYCVAVVNSVANDTQITLTKPIANADLIGDGFKMQLIGRVGNTTVAPLGYPLQAFNNKLNDNVVRYYSSSMIEYDTYDTMQLKIVLLSDLQQVNVAGANTTPTTFPRVDDIRAVGVTA